MGGQRSRAGERNRTGGAGGEGERDPRSGSPGIDPGRVEWSGRFRDPAPSDARRDRADGHPPDAPADELEQAGGRPDSGSLPADALQQDEEVRHPRRREGIALVGARVEHAWFQHGVKAVRRGRAFARLIGVALWRAFLCFYSSDNLTYAASIAYYALLSLFPLALLAVTVLGQVTADETDRNSVLVFVLQYFPTQFEFITSQLDILRHQGLTLGVAGTIALVWGAVGVFGAISTAVNYAWRVKQPRTF